MGIIDKSKFESRGDVGCSNSDYCLERTTCCGAFCVEDDELSDLYFDPMDLRKTVFFERGCACPRCGATEWIVVEVWDVSEAPDEWKWACKSMAEAVWNRLVNDLQTELRADPTNVTLATRLWNALDVRKSPVNALTCFGACVTSSPQGCVALARAFKELMLKNGVVPIRAIFSDEIRVALRRACDALGGPERAEVQWLVSMLDNGVILILEDDQSRVERFIDVLHSIMPTAQLIFWRNAKKMIAEVDVYLPYARLISLDHDLYPMAVETEDPGDGLEVAKYLAERKPACPIIIHSSNGERARMMAGEFELAGCPAKVVAPLGNDWVEAYWAKVVETLLKQNQQEPKA